MNRYKIIMSKGSDILFDDTEVAKVISGIKTKNPTRLKQALFNPAFYVQIVKVDPEKMRVGGEYNPVTGTMQGGRMEELGFDELEDMFSGTPLQLEDKNKKLN